MEFYSIVFFAGLNPCSVRRSTLFSIQKRLGMESVHVNIKTTSEEHAQAVLDIKEHDLTGQWGVTQVRQHLANQGILIKWSEIIVLFDNHEMLM